MTDIRVVSGDLRMTSYNIMLNILVIIYVYVFGTSSGQTNQYYSIGAFGIYFSAAQSL